MTDSKTLVAIELYQAILRLYGLWVVDECTYLVLPCIVATFSPPHPSTASCANSNTKAQFNRPNVSRLSCLYHHARFVLFSVVLSHVVINQTWEPVCRRRVWARVLTGTLFCFFDMMFLASVVTVLCGLLELPCWSFFPRSWSRRWNTSSASITRIDSTNRTGASSNQAIDQSFKQPSNG